MPLSRSGSRRLKEFRARSPYRLARRIVLDAEQHCQIDLYGWREPNKKDLEHHKPLFQAILASFNSDKKSTSMALENTNMASNSQLRQIGGPPSDPKRALTGATYRPIRSFIPYQKYTIGRNQGLPK